MKNRKWKMNRGEGNANTLSLGERLEQLPDNSLISLTRGEGLNYFQLFINQLLNFMIMNQLKKTPGLLYAELNGELKNHRGTGQTITVWDRKAMPTFRKSGKHGFAMKFFTWAAHRKNTENYYLSYTSSGPIPTAEEAKVIVRKYAKFYHGGKVVRYANPKALIDDGMK